MPKKLISIENQEHKLFNCKGESINLYAFCTLNLYRKAKHNYFVWAYA
jgi:hypothetical protein